MDWLWITRFLAIPLALYVLLIVGIALAGSRTPRRLISVGIAIGVLWTLALMGFWTWAEEVRGGGAGIEEEASRARVVFVALFAAMFAVAYAFGRVVSVGRVAVVAAVVFALATAYHVEYVNACYVGKPLIWPNYIGCG